jgi:hypothetical protein
MGPSPFLFSAGPQIKFEINRRFRRDRHYIWCSECFDARKTWLHPAVRVPPSSNPAEIYASLLAATVDRMDLHDKNVRDWRSGIKFRALQWALNHEITDDDFAEIVVMADHEGPQSWRPLLYIIDRSAVDRRLRVVNPSERANPGAPEYIIPDLGPEEFDVITY